MASVTIPRPAVGEFNPYYGKYIDLVPKGDLLEVLASQSRETSALLGGISEERSHFKYGPDKWSIREVVGHLCDAERVFAYRALTFARSDATPLPPFDENAWAKVSNAEQRDLQEHVREFGAVRSATLALFGGLTEKELERAGVASNNRITVRALAYIIAGHERHHVQVLKERYLRP